MQISANLKELEYHEVVAEQIRIIDEILDSVGAQGIFENPNITFDEWWRYEHDLQFRIFRVHRNSTTLDFCLQAKGMRIDVEGYQETCEFSSKTILEQGTKVTEILERLITCSVLVESKGGARFINLFNPDGSRYAIWSLQSFSD